MIGVFLSVLSKGFVVELKFLYEGFRNKREIMELKLKNKK